MTLRINRTFVACMFVLVNPIAPAVAQVTAREWNGIVPCSSTRAEIEKRFGSMKPSERTAFELYVVSGQRVTIRYQTSSRGPHINDLVHKVEVAQQNLMTIKQYSRLVPDFPKSYVKTVVNDGRKGMYSAVYQRWDKGQEVWVQKGDHGREVVEKLGYFHPKWDCSME